MTADDKWLPDADVKHSRKGFSSSRSPVSRTTPELLTLSDPFSNPIPFPAASCPEWLLWLTPFMEQRGKKWGLWVCVCASWDVCLSRCVFARDAHFVHKHMHVCGILFSALVVCVWECVYVVFSLQVWFCVRESPLAKQTQTPIKAAAVFQPLYITNNVSVEETSCFNPSHPHFSIFSFITHW